MDIPAILQQSIDILLQHRIVDRISKIDSSNRGGVRTWSITCEIKIPTPNYSMLPELITIEVVIDDNYPVSQIDCYSKTEQLRGFPHQGSLNHKLCLRESWRAENNEKKLSQCLNWAKQWILDCAEGKLASSSDPYELPDFSSSSQIEINMANRQFLFNEDSKSYRIWQDFLGKNGVVEFSMPYDMNAFLLSEFMYDDRIVYKSGFMKPHHDTKYNLRGIWQLVPSIYYHRYRPPQTFGELRELFKMNDINLDALLKKAWEMNSYNPVLALLLIGFPIPEFFRGKNEEIHWIPVIFYSERQDKNKLKKKMKKKDLWRYVLEYSFSNVTPIHWGDSFNISQNRQFIRGKLHNDLRKKAFTILGCGALGSHIAEYLVREGIRNISLFDNDILMMGNLSRHTLDGGDVGLPKSFALERRLTRISPLSTVQSFSNHVPNLVGKNNPALVIEKTDVLIDCTTDHNAFLWLNSEAENHNIRLVSIYFNFTSDICTVLVSGENHTCGNIYEDLMSKVKSGVTNVDSKAYFQIPTKNELIIEGIGCWHATFPGKEHEIALLAALAVDLIGTQLTLTKGMAALIKRNKYEDYQKNKQMVELLFIKNDYE